MLTWDKNHIGGVTDTHTATNVGGIAPKGEAECVLSNVLSVGFVVVVVVFFPQRTVHVRHGGSHKESTGQGIANRDGDQVMCHGISKGNVLHKVVRTQQTGRAEEHVRHGMFKANAHKG